MRQVLAALAATALVGALAAGCATDDRASAPCVAAFRNADPAALPPSGVSPLDDAIRACETVEAWTDAWDRVPEAHPASRDAREYLEQRCRIAELGATGLCRDLAAGDG